MEAVRVVVSPGQISVSDAITAAVGRAFTVIIIVVVVAHWPPPGVKVYVVVAVLSSAGDQLPVIILLEVVGNAVSISPEQIAGTAVNVGVTAELTVIVNVVVVAHCPASGVNVYVVVVVLSRAGDHVPVIILLEVVGNALSEPPVQIGATGSKVGVVEPPPPTVTVTVPFPIQAPEVSVTVYICVLVGLAVTEAPVVALNPVAGLQL